MRLGTTECMENRPSVTRRSAIVQIPFTANQISSGHEAGGISWKQNSTNNDITLMSCSFGFYTDFMAVGKKSPFPLFG